MWIRKLTIVVALTLGASCSDNGNVASEVSIHYVRIGVETYSAVTPESIESETSRHSTIRSSDTSFERIMNIIDSAEPGEDFDRYRVRVKISIPGTDPIYIDNDGVVSSFSGGTTKLSADSLNELKGRIEEILY